jgi:MarR family transcriptional regulator for hemolysin
MTGLAQYAVDECSREVLEVVPIVMRDIRNQLRKHGATEISVPQFRVLTFLSRSEGASLSKVAEYIGLTLPSMSALVDSLVAGGLVTRQTHPEDRRRMTLTLTEGGRARLKSARASTANYLSQKLNQLSAADRMTVGKCMKVLRTVFTQGEVA